MMTALVSGGDGFIGSNLIKKLLKNEFKIINIDNNITSYPQEFFSEDYTKITEDISHINIDKIEKIDVIIHLASVASPIVYKNNPDLVLYPNVIGTKKLLELAERDNSKFFFASTSEVYGNVLPSIEGIKENDCAYTSLLTERSCYSAAKRFGEELTLNFINKGGQASNLRFFNVYGNNMDLKHIGYGRVIPNIFYNLRRNKKINIFGDGKQIRSFIWIDDLVEGIFEIINCSKKLPNAINIGNKEPISIIELAYSIGDLLNKQVEFNFLKNDSDEPTWRVPNINLIMNLTSWKPNTNLLEGLKKIADKDM